MPTFLVITHHGKTARVEVDDGRPVTVGRDPGCDVVLDDRRVSRRHATIRAEGATLELADLGSHNGTYVLVDQPAGPGDTVSLATQSRVAPGAPVPVSAGSVIQIGAAVITVEGASAPAASFATDAIVIDPAMRRLYQLASRVAASELPVLIVGESGVGKEVVAQFIHRHSRRAAHRMLGVNCGAIAEPLVEAELFGYERGAFTGALRSTPGLLETADGGAVFLDEIGELAPAAQVKLLRAVELGQVLRVGGREPIAIDVRYVAATNRDLALDIGTGRFREDLYYRLNGITLAIPPLRDRPSEIVPIARALLAGEPTGDRASPRELSQLACDRLVAHAWPGNVRELKNVVRRAIVVCDGPVIEPAHLELPGAPRGSPDSIDAAGAPGVEEVADSPAALHQRAEALERARIVEALEACAGNQTRTAQRLGLTRRALVARLEKYDLPRPRKRR